MSKKDVKTFPLRLDSNFSNVIDKAVFFTKTSSKHQYVLDAIKEKIERDNNAYPQILNNEVM